MKKALIMVALLAISMTFTGCFTNPSTPPGHEGYVKESPRVWGTGGFRGTMVGPENFGISPWRNHVMNVDFRPQTYSESFNILAKDELNISFNFNAILMIKPGTIKTVVEEYGGKNWFFRYVKEPLRASVRKNVQPLDSRDIKTKRTEISDAILSEMNTYLSKTPFVMMSGVVGNLDYPDVVTQAVEAKLAAKQLLDEKETQKLIAKADASIRIEKARGIAEAQKIINSTLTDQYLMHEAIEAQRSMADSPNHTTVYIPSGANGIPLVKTTNN